MLEPFCAPRAAQVDTSKTETEQIDALSQGMTLNIQGQAGLLAASRGEQKRAPARFSVFGQKKDPTEDDGGGAPIGRLRLSTRDLFASQPYRTWYRLEDESGLTHMCIAVIVRYWDPVPRVPVFRFSARDGPSREEQEREKERAANLSKTKAMQLAKKKEREIQKSVGMVCHKLSSGPQSAKHRVNLLGKLLFMLGCSTGARVTKSGASKGKKDIDDGEHKKNLQGQLATMSIDRMDPTEAQARVPVPELLKRKAEMVRQGVLEECVANLNNPRVAETAAARVGVVPSLWARPCGSPFFKLRRRSRVCEVSTLKRGATRSLRSSGIVRAS